MAKISEKKIKTETELATDAISNQFKALTTIAEIENNKESNNENKSEKKTKKDQLVTFTLPAEDYEKYKIWFGSKGLSMSMGIRMCLDYVNYNDISNKLNLTKSGIRENPLLNLN